MSLSELKKDPELNNSYLSKRDIPLYPKPLVFYVPNVMHVTDKSGYQGIIKDGGFRIQQYEKKDNFLWFNLSLTEEEIAHAEYNFLQGIPYPHYKNQSQGFLKDFTTSPAFQRESRYGNFCFTFSLKELLHRYACQFCHHTAPVFRVLDTQFYRKEIMYSVLVHPRHIDHYNQYSRLPRGDEYVCGYSQGYMSWSCQAPSGAHGYEFVVNKKKGKVYGEKLKQEIFYVWDNVAVAFHMEPEWVLRVKRQRLHKSVTTCKVSPTNLLRDPANSYM